MTLLLHFYVHYFWPKSTHALCALLCTLFATLINQGARSCKSELQLKVNGRKIIWAGRPTGQKPAQILSHKSLVHDLGLVEQEDEISPASCLLLIRTAWCRRLSNSVDKDALCCQFFLSPSDTVSLLLSGASLSIPPQLLA